MTILCQKGVVFSKRSHKRPGGEGWVGIKEEDPKGLCLWGGVGLGGLPVWLVINF